MSMNEHVVDRAAKQLASDVRDAVSRKDLIDAIGNREDFDKLYIDLSNRTIQAYQASHRKRSSLKLHASLAALEECGRSSRLPSTRSDPPNYSRAATEVVNLQPKSCTHNSRLTTLTTAGSRSSRRSCRNAPDFRAHSTCLRTDS